MPVRSAGNTIPKHPAPPTIQGKLTRSIRCRHFSTGRPKTTATSQATGAPIGKAKIPNPKNAFNTVTPPSSQAEADPTASPKAPNTGAINGANHTPILSRVVKNLFKSLFPYPNHRKALTLSGIAPQDYYRKHTSIICFLIDTLLPHDLIGHYSEFGHFCPCWSVYRVCYFCKGCRGDMLLSA